MTQLCLTTHTSQILTHTTGMTQFLEPCTISGECRFRKSVGNCERCSAYKLDHLYRVYCNFIDSLRRQTVKCWLLKKSKRSRSVLGYGVGCYPSIRPGGLWKATRSVVGGMIFWSVLRGRLRLKCYGTSAETRFRLSAKRTSPFKSSEASVQSTNGSRGVRISGSNAGYTMFRGSVKSTGYPLHSPVSPSLALPCVTVCHHISTGLYQYFGRTCCLSCRAK